MSLPETDNPLKHTFKIWIPTRCFCKRELPEGLRSMVLQEVKRKLSQWFGGFNLYHLDSSGYAYEDGALEEAPCDIVEAFSTQNSFDNYCEDFVRMAADVAGQLTQECLMVSIDNKPKLYAPPKIITAQNCAHTGVVALIFEKGAPPPVPLPLRDVDKLNAIREILRSFNSAEHARKLYCDILNYNHTSGELPSKHWPGSIRSLLKGLPMLLADHNDFKILYLHLSAEELRRGDERQLVQRIFKDDPTFRGLVVVSDNVQKKWELINIKTRSDGFKRLVLRRLRVGVEAVRTATERLATLEITEAEESTVSAEELQIRHEKAFDVESVTKAFFADLANWYFWALKHVCFPKDAPKEKDGRDHVSVIRLITRLIFCWFMKEKGLIPAELFNERKLTDLLVDFAPGKVSNKHSAFYRAILQNLFFATLNTEMNKRGWRRNGQNFMAHSLYRHKGLFIRPDEALAFFKLIPFLNGGLFECLDKILENKGHPYYERIDGFSDRSGSQPTVPDFLFFGEERELDLSKDYGDKKYKKVKVRGLIHTLNHYHFTVEESTPLEEEVALDPELAGRIFENLLAAYNPETGATARKQTGSFYTPREIVNYMVDEALINYLKGKIEESSPEATDVEPRLRHVFSYEDDGHRFKPNEVEVLIAGIDQLKALDPAVGSGAFPMGILHKLVFILGRLDPRNEKWKERQKQRLQDAIKSAELIEDVTIRENTLNELEQQISGIEEAFEKNTLDYGRKLYLIENCLYGVDIQPIAVQIAKMRFFISLIADQKVAPTAENLGVRPLPNLETKLVAANTLIGIEKPKQRALRSPRIDKLEIELRRVRERGFYARTATSKAKCRDGDKKLRIEIAELLKRDGWPDKAAEQLARWDPYDQNASSDFFDPVWMFAIHDGFSITLGNPPYVRADEQSDWNQHQRREILASQQYQTLWEKWDLYVPFIERSFQLLRPGGISTLIVSDAFCHSKYAQKPQNWFLNHARILRLDFCADVKIFDAAVHNLIYFFQKAEGSQWKPERRVHHETFGNVTLLPTDMQKKLTHRAFFPQLEEQSRFSAPTLTLGDICYLSYGLAASSDEKLHKGEFVTEEVTQDFEDKKHPKPWVEGKLLAKWLPIGNRWLEWGTARAPSHFRRITFEELFEVPEKILIMRVAGNDLRSCYDTQQLYTNHTSIIVVPWNSLRDVRNNSLKKATRYIDEEPPRPDLPKREKLESTSRRFAIKYLLGVMNSAAARDFLRANRRSNTDLYPDDWKKLPIPDVDTGKQASIVKLVDRILTAKKKNRNADISADEEEVDKIVYKLYGLTKDIIKIVKEDR